VNGQTLELDLERVALHSGLSVWLFSQDSVARIPIIAKMPATRRLNGICHCRRSTGHWSGLRYGAASAWFCLAAALAAFSKLLSRFALWLTQQGVKRIAPHWNLNALPAFVGPLRLLLSISLFRAGME